MLLTVTTSKFKFTVKFIRVFCNRRRRRRRINVNDTFILNVCFDSFYADLAHIEWMKKMQVWKKLFGICNIVLKCSN